MLWTYFCWFLPLGLACSFGVLMTIWLPSHSEACGKRSKPDSRMNRCTVSGLMSSVASVSRYRWRMTSVAAVAFSGWPSMRKWWPRRPTRTSMRRSICLRCSSNWPHRTASRRWSAGLRSNCRASVVVVNLSSGFWEPDTGAQD
ncbi:cytochrome bd oxidase small subunit, CydX/CbdX family [Marinobacter sp. OP 3.4]|uniref:cytochrome bd oxidase small subunit, CydX/CbdX family n=1 Tax=Marinobacter sp. OP 3.4 TaxID=3076501 RepID=UPI003FA5711F